MPEFEFAEVSDEQLEKMIDSLERAIEESEYEAWENAQYWGHDRISLGDEYMISDMQERLALLKREMKSRKVGENAS